MSLLSSTRVKLLKVSEGVEGPREIDGLVAEEVKCCHGAPHSLVP